MEKLDEKYDTPILEIVESAMKFHSLLFVFYIFFFLCNGSVFDWKIKFEFRDWFVYTFELEIDKMSKSNKIKRGRTILSEIV